MNIVKLDSSNFNNTIHTADKTVIVDFYADWCVPCKMITPVLEEIAREKSEEVAVYKVNIDENPELAKQFSVMTIPNVISFKNGQFHRQAVGVQPKDSLLKLVE